MNEECRQILSPFKRVNYSQGLVLGVEDFQHEQNYFNEKQRVLKSLWSKARIMRKATCHSRCEAQLSWISVVNSAALGQATGSSSYQK